MPKIKNQSKSVSAFTLIEMVIVLVIIGILLMATIYLSGEQIQKVKNKAVKESIVAEMQSRYSRNLWSSSFAGNMYSSLEVSLNAEDNKILFDYKDNTWSTTINNIFTDKFKIKYIALNYAGESTLDSTWNIVLKYTPYKIFFKKSEKKWLWFHRNNSNGRKKEFILYVARNLLTEKTNPHSQRNRKPPSFCVNKNLVCADSCVCLFFCCSSFFSWVRSHSPPTMTGAPCHRLGRLLPWLLPVWFSQKQKQLLSFSEAQY